jgi:uncharacterized protein (TIGR02996 family)
MAKASIREALWQAILEDREDDLPRLAFADWLEENGDEARARFIRLQIEQAKCDEDDPRHWRLEAEIRPLWKANEKAWRAEVPAWCRERMVFRRGFASTAGSMIGGTIAAMLRSGRPLLRKQPIESLMLVEGKAEDVATVLSWPEAANLRELSLWKCEIDARVVASLGALRSLSILQVPFELGLVRLLVGQPSLAGLHSLRWEKRIRGAQHEPCVLELEALVGGPWRQLHSLRLGSMQLGPPEAALLAAAAALRGLRELDLQLSPLEDAGVEALVRTEWPSLQSLGLSYCRFGDGGMAALLAWPRLPELRNLQVRNTAPAARLLASTPATRRLVHLDVSSNGLGDEGFRAFAESTTLPELLSLRVADNDIKEPGLRALRAPNALSRLERLDLSMNFSRDQAARCLLESPHLPALSWLNMRICHLSEAMLAALARRFPHVGEW